jgi:hypothetical protein
MSFLNIFKIFSFSLYSQSHSQPIIYRQYYSSLQNHNQISYFKSKAFEVNNSSISEEMLTEEIHKF